MDRRTGDRRRRRRFVRDEKRSGFDRRRLQGGRQPVVAFENALLRLRDRPGRLLLILAAVNVFNLADFLLTLNVLESGGEEANPIMRGLFGMGPLWAGLFKVVAVLVASLLVWRCRNFRDALAVALAMLAIFTVVLVYHVAGLLAYA